MTGESVGESAFSSSKAAWRGVDGEAKRPLAVPLTDTGHLSQTAGGDESLWNSVVLQTLLCLPMVVE